MNLRVGDAIDAVDWVQAKAALTADRFDNGRSASGLRRSFAQSQHVVFVWDGDEIVGMARMLSDGVCNAYLLDVWTKSSHRRRGIAREMVQRLADAVPGLHIGLQTDDAQPFYVALGFAPQPEFWARISGGWLANDVARAE